VNLSILCVVRIDFSVLRSIESTKEPIYPETADYLDLYSSSKAHPSPYDIWQIQLEKQRLIDWFHTTWQSTTQYSTTGRPIDGLIMLVTLHNQLMTGQETTVSLHLIDLIVMEHTKNPDMGSPKPPLYATGRSLLFQPVFDRIQRLTCR
jgi:hypothetical protein